jgi:hypothetical protein
LGMELKTECEGDDDRSSFLFWFGEDFWRDCNCNNPDFLHFFSWYLFQDPQFILLSILITTTKS